MKSSTFSIILEILAVFVSSKNCCHPGNIGNEIFPIFCNPGNAGGSRGQAPGGLDYFENMFPEICGYPGNIGNTIICIFVIFTKKGARRNFTQNRGGHALRSLI